MKTFITYLLYAVAQCALAAPRRSYGKQKHARHRGQLSGWTPGSVESGVKFNECSEVDTADYAEGGLRMRCDARGQLLCM